MKYFAFGLCISAALANALFSIWEHDLKLAAAHGLAMLGWSSALFAHWAKDNP